jgi:hypothetical protein
MIRAVNLISVAIIIVVSVALYHIKYETSATARQVVELREQVAAERDLVSVLRAEWSHLNQPARLQDLAMRHLQLVPITVDQMVTLQELPARPREAEPARPEGN